MRNFIFLSFLLLLGTSTRGFSDTFSEFGILRANIAHYCSEQRWLVCFEPKRIPHATEIVGFDAEGNIFRIHGDLRQGAANLLDLESYQNPSISFSTKEGYFYIWNASDGNPFEFPLKANEYAKLLRKFQLYPLLNLSNDSPISFKLLKENPEFYDRVIALPRPQSMFHHDNPKVRRVKIGIFPAGRPDNRGFIVGSVLKDSAAEAAGIKPRDFISKLVVNGVNYDMDKGFPLPDDKPIRILSLRVGRKTEKSEISYSDVNVFPPSALEYFLWER